MAQNTSAAEKEEGSGSVMPAQYIIRIKFRAVVSYVLLYASNLGNGFSLPKFGQKQRLVLVNSGLSFRKPDHETRVAFILTCRRLTAPPLVLILTSDLSVVEIRSCNPSGLIFIVLDKIYFSILHVADKVGKCVKPKQIEGAGFFVEALENIFLVFD
ncbi:hypothetical protein EVAR_103475_1 [Eumeta japonica]|uniref:Uncharacterized protein n=1 Tax=Eumeta variegata TaxID=151549 RepID=A0A4C1YY75_EUMVA|nr:hypothetical protein EVAR_103475_1 [Eumeta japonica]